MKLVVQVRLLPTPVQAAALEATLRACNEAVTWVSGVAFEKDVKSNFALREHTYRQIKARWGLGAQAAQHVIKKTCDAYATLKAAMKAGNLGRPGSQRYRRAVEKPVAFHPQGAQPYDDRMLSWQIDQRRISIWTTAGRMKDVEFTAAPEHLATLALHRKGESDLVCRDGMWFLNATCEVPEAAPNTEPVDFLGIDLGIVNIATTSDGQIMAGRALNRLRARERTLRTKLQKKNTPSARRRLKKRRRKEARRARDINHKIAKHVVAEAERTGRGIALEDLTGIRERVRLRKPGGHPRPEAGGGPPTPAGPSPNWGSSSRTRPAEQGCRWCTSIRRTPPAPAPSAATSTRRTGSPRPGSRAGAADSLITQTGTAPATFAQERGHCGDAGRSQPPQPHSPHRKVGQDANAAPQPVAPVVQARDLSPEWLTSDGSLTKSHRRWRAASAGGLISTWTQPPATTSAATAAAHPWAAASCSACSVSAPPGWPSRPGRSAGWRARSARWQTRTPPG
ncbi:transposase [Streptomyces himastatinicus ATCC 53653]|uniref:Transposase n=1 Tax=Streptomyces himastatinicus ATCC 53653 TaxID=457427 RepID=D9WF27_9ACTN|nr:transposase [Streptomyces himastatinicus ATCC 53653]